MSAQPQQLPALSAQEDPAPLWRRANCTRHPPNQRHSVIGNETAVSSLVLFQQSLRAYPNHPDRINAAKKQRPVGQRPVTHNYITNLESEQSTPFFLDYLNQQEATMNPMSTGNVFDHRKFMNTYQNKPRDKTITSSIASGDAGNSLAPIGDGKIQAKSIPSRHGRSANQDSLRTLISDHSDYSNENSIKDYGPVVLRKHRTRDMENKNSRSSANLNERLQNVAERRAQIESAKQERLNRQIEQMNRPNNQQTSAMFSSTVLSQNPSLAFGSTRSRNLDLNRPQVTYVHPSGRPKSEIFASTPIASKFARENYTERNTSQIDSSQAPNLMTKSMMVQSASCQSFVVTPQQSQNQQQISFRAARRHDPELVPVVQKYIFREWAAPGSIGTGTSMRKEHSAMTASMTSTRSYHVGGGGMTSRFQGSCQGNRPKKSFSMNRLDQLAQPRRRIEPKMTTSTSFVRPQVTPAKKTTEVPVRPSTTSKLVPPQKSVEKVMTKALPKVGTPRPMVSARPRPLSTIEPLESSQSSAKKIDTAKSTPEVEEKGTPEEEAEKLAAYKRVMAEKRALFRKQQEQQKLQQEQQPVRKAKIVKPEPAQVEIDSSSSSSSDSESEDTKTLNQNDSNLEESSVTDLLTSKDSLENSLKIIEENAPSEPQPMNLMTTSCDPSLLISALSSDKDSNSSSGTEEPAEQKPLNISANRSAPRVISDEKAHIERMLRKNRVQEILNRTVNKDKMNGKVAKPNGDSNGNSNGDQLVNDLLGLSVDENGQELAKDESQKNQTNGHGQANGHAVNGNAHYQAFNAHPLESLPSTNGF